MNSDDIAVFDAQIVADDTVYARATIIQIVVVKHDQNGVFSLLALDQYSITT